MKLYTRNEIKLMLENMGTYTEESVEYFLDELTPIELPSDEDIETYVKSTGYYGHCTQEYHEGIEEGAKWLRNKIKKQQ